MSFVLDPPISPMLATLTRELPRGSGFLYEPKWDGFRCIAFRSGNNVDLRSRNARPLARYFPEIVNALKDVPAGDFVIDGELVVSGPNGLDFTALLQRLHPAASRVEMLRAETPACFVAFDLLADDEDARARPFEQRRGLLERLLGDADHPHIVLTPLTDDADVARLWLERFDGAGIDGVMVKTADMPYTPGRRNMLKVKNERTAECVVAGFRPHDEEAAVGSLLLALVNTEGHLDHVGLCASFTAARRRELLKEVLPYVTTLDEHPWRLGFGKEPGPVGRLPGAASRWSENGMLTWIPLRPELVCEVSYDHFEGSRFRHAPRFRRWRPDRDASSCTYEQFGTATGASLDEMLARS